MDDKLKDLCDFLDYQIKVLESLKFNNPEPPPIDNSNVPNQPIK